MKQYLRDTLGKDKLRQASENESVLNSPELVATNPLKYRGWDSLVASDPGGSLFYTTAWAQVLQQSYGHRPFYLCRAKQGNLQGLLPIMEVSSPWTGRRGVSLPFTDVCPPLSVSERPGDLYALAMKVGRERGWKFLECRGGNWEWPGVVPSLEFWGHCLDLERNEELLFRGLTSSVRRAVRKAQRTKVKVEFRSDLEAMKDFFRLHCVTRHRHGVPPQPWFFFENVARLILLPGHGHLVCARSENRLVAASLFFHFGEDAVYKFGASDYEFQNLRPNNLVLWEAIKRYSANGFARLHLGRTSLANRGLRRFKLGFGAVEEKIRYFKYSFRKEAFVKEWDHSEGRLGSLFKRLPPGVLRFVGAMAYRHLS